MRLVEPLPHAQRLAAGGALTPCDEVERSTRVTKQFGLVPLLEQLEP